MIRQIAILVGILFVALNSLWAAPTTMGTVSNNEPILIHFQIHPRLKDQACAALPTQKALNGESEFPKLLKMGWVKLLSSDYKKRREFYPCRQDLEVSFPTANSPS